MSRMFSEIYNLQDTASWLDELIDSGQRHACVTHDKYEIDEFQNTVQVVTVKWSHKKISHETRLVN